MLQLVILFLSVIVGGFLGLRSKSIDRIKLKSALTFSASFILGITVLHLMPSIFSDFKIQFGFWVLAGFFVQIFLETMSSGVEHGHIHTQANAPRSWATQILVGLSIHAFMEGMPLMNMDEYADQHSHRHLSGSWNYFLSIVLHKVPAAYALVMLLKHSGYSRNFVIFCMLIFAIMSPLGAVTIASFEVNQYVYQCLLAFVIGAFLHISTTIMFESDAGSHHKLSWRKLFYSFLGIAMAVLAEIF